MLLVYVSPMAVARSEVAMLAAGVQWHRSVSCLNSSPVAITANVRVSIYRTGSPSSSIVEAAPG